MMLKMTGIWRGICRILHKVADRTGWADRLTITLWVSKIISLAGLPIILAARLITQDGAVQEVQTDINES
jgi:hypothetical protein